MATIRTGDRAVLVVVDVQVDVMKGCWPGRGTTTMAAADMTFE